MPLHLVKFVLDLKKDNPMILSKLHPWQGPKTTKNDIKKKVTFSTFGASCRLGPDLCQYFSSRSRKLSDGTAEHTIAPSETTFAIQTCQASKKITASEPASPKMTKYDVEKRCSFYPLPPLSFGFRSPPIFIFGT
jgi:hypothetical protein